MAPATQARLSPDPLRKEPPALRINRGHRDTTGLERLLLQLAESRAGSDARLGSALDELQSRINGQSTDGDSARHVESLEERIADLARQVQQSDAVEAGQHAHGGIFDLDAQFQELNAALDASLTATSPQHRSRIEADPSATGLLELQAIADRLQSIDDAVNAAGARASRIESLEAQLSELMEFIRTFEPKLEQVAQQAAVRVAFQFEESQQATDASARLDAIQRDLGALTQRAGNMDERTLTTLETISGTLQRLADRIATAEAAAAGIARDGEPPESGDSRRAAKNPGDSRRATQPGDSRQATKNPGDSRQATKSPGDSRQAIKNPGKAPIQEPEAQETPIEEPVSQGAEVIDPAPAGDAKPGDSRQATEPGDSRQATNKKPETAAIETHPAPSRRLASDARKPRKILVIAAVVLLMVSAGLLYGRLNTHSTSAPGPGDRLAPTAPAPAEPSSNHGGSHAGPPETRGGAEKSPEGENTQQPPLEPETIPASRFDRASLMILEPRPFDPDLILKSRSH